MIARGVIAGAAALLVGALVVRNAAVAAYAESRPQLAAKVWKAHPASEISEAMTKIAKAAHDRRAVPDSAFALMRDAAAKEPLAPEPFLVRGVQAQLAGDSASAQRAFEAAQWRDPRSLPAAYFLADRYFRAGNVQGGLRETAALVRLSPAGAATVAPYLAAYGSNSANWPALKALFRTDPQLAAPTLIALASKVETAPAVLALADPRQSAQQAQWLTPLLNTLTRTGRYEQARAIWAQKTGVRFAVDQLLYDAGFTDRSSPPPFNWDLSSSTVGIAERQPGGRLHLVYYGQEDGFLASQLLLLQPGHYRLSLQLLGDPARAHVLSWSIWCGQSGQPAASVTLDVAAARGWRFEVPAGCPAQWLKLSGASADISQQTDVTIGGLRLVKEQPGA
jgi:hypothetical protein